MLIPLGETTRNPAEELNDEGEVVDGGEDPGCACSESVWKLKHLPTTCIFFTGHASAPFVSICWISKGQKVELKQLWPGECRPRQSHASIFTLYLQYLYNFIHTYLYSGNWKLHETVKLPDTKMTPRQWHLGLGPICSTKERKDRCLLRASPAKGKLPRNKRRLKRKRT